MLGTQRLDALLELSRIASATREVVDVERRPGSAYHYLTHQEIGSFDYKQVVGVRSMDTELRDAPGQAKP